jgi:serine/threonine-protein kinase
MPTWSRITALFEQAIDLAGDAREQLLTRAAESDPAAASEVRALLAAHERAGGFLQTPAWASDPALLNEWPDPPRYTPGQQIGPYRIQHEIGRGGMGIVYAAEDVRLGRTVALKALPASYARDTVARERLAREARAAAVLTHPGIATIYALEEIDGDLFIASELVRGSTLRSEIAAGPLGGERLLRTLLDIADALDAAHQRGIVHRDLKPENVMRDVEGRIKIVDFGLARTLAPAPDAQTTLTLAGALLGTPAYMAPEQLRGEAADARADIFAFGVMGYELAMGTHPFGGGDPSAMLERLVSRTPPLARTLDSAALDLVIRKCLHSDRFERFANGGELATALRAASGGPIAHPAAAPTLWWWQFHQIAVAVLSGAALAPMWWARPWIRPIGSGAFLAALVLVTIAVTLRGHLWFTSNVHPDTLRAHRSRVLPWIIGCEAALLVLLLIVGLTISGAHDGVSAWLIVTALLLLVSLAVIEPATTRAALT